MNSFEHYRSTGTPIAETDTVEWWGKEWTGAALTQMITGALLVAAERIQSRGLDPDEFLDDVEANAEGYATTFRRHLEDAGTRGTQSHDAEARARMNRWEMEEHQACPLQINDVRIVPRWKLAAWARRWIGEASVWTYKSPEDYTAEVRTLLKAPR